MPRRRIKPSPVLAQPLGTATGVPVNSVLPLISGIQTQGQALSVSNGSWSQFPSSFAYQWKRAGVAISGATSQTYVLQLADVGVAITATVTASNTGFGAGAAATSSNSVTPNATLTISGTPGTTATVGNAYSFTPTTAGGHTPKAFSVVNLPSWAAFTSSTGQITGTPSGAEVDAGIVITVTDNDGLTASLASFTITVTAASTLVTPSASADGTQTWSGRTAPVDPTRTTAKCGLRPLVPTTLRATANIDVAVTADALGDIAYVDFWFEGGTQRISAPSAWTFTDANGFTVTYDGFVATLNIAAAKAVSTTGKWQWYATAHAIDGTILDRTMGPHNVYVRAVDYDWDKTVKSSGGDFTTLRAAIDAMGSAAPEAGRITIYITGSHAIAPAGAVCNAGKGWHRIQAAAGVTATLIHTGAFDATNASGGWDAFLAAEGIEFYGAGIVVDLKYFRQITTGGGRKTQGLWMNGCRFTNSIGTSSTLYWNKGPQPQFIVSADSSADVPLIWTEATVEFCQAPLGYQNALVRGCKINDTPGTLFDNPLCVVGTYIGNSSTSYYRHALDALSIHNSVATSATISKDYANNADGSLYLYANGSPTPVKRYDFSRVPVTPDGTGGKWFDIASIVTDINGLGSGWAATLIDATRASWGISGENTFTNLDVRGATQTLQTFFSFHDEMIHFRGTSMENVIFRDNPSRNCFNSTAWIDFECPMLDAFIRDNPWENGGNGAGGNTSMPAGCSHLVFEGNFFDGTPGATGTETSGPGGFSTNAGTVDAYCSAANNIFGGGISAISNTWPSYPKIINNALVPAVIGMPAGANDSGNVNLTNATNLAACFTSKSTGDFRPSASGLLHTNLKPRRKLFDGRVNTRASSDAIGPWAEGYSAPSYPF